MCGCNLNRADKETIVDSLKEQRITVNQAPYLDYALEIENYNYLKAVEAFKKGWIPGSGCQFHAGGRGGSTEAGQTTAWMSAQRQAGNPCIWQIS